MSEFEHINYPTEKLDPIKLLTTQVSLELVEQKERYIRHKLHELGITVEQMMADYRLIEYPIQIEIVENDGENIRYKASQEYRLIHKDDVDKELYEYEHGADAPVVDP